MKGKRLTIDTLKAGEWCDKDEVLICAAFQILVDFVEKEDPEKLIDWSWNEDHKNAWDEISSLYKWWKEERPSRKDPLFDADMDDKEAFLVMCDESTKLEKIWNDEDTRNLHRLIDIRFYLWT
jgi:hypothetical protein